MPEKPKHVIEIITPALLNKYPSSGFYIPGRFSQCKSVFFDPFFCLLISQRAGIPWKRDICPLVQREANKPSTFRRRLKTFTVILCVQAALVFLRRLLVKNLQSAQTLVFLCSCLEFQVPRFASLTRSSMSVFRSAVLSNIKVE